MEIRSTWTILSHFYLCFVTCLQLRPKSISSSARNQEVYQDPTGQKKKKDLNRNGEKNRKSCGDRRKKVDDTNWNTEGAVEGRCEEHGKGKCRTGTDFRSVQQCPVPPCQSCHNLPPCFRGRRTRSLSPDGCLTLVLPALTQPSRATQHSQSSSPRPEHGTHSPAPNTAWACTANLHFGKGQDVVIALHRSPSDQRLSWHKWEERATEPRGKLPGCAAASSSYAQRDLKSSITLIFNRVTFNEL